MTDNCIITDKDIEAIIAEYYFHLVKVDVYLNGAVVAIQGKAYDCDFMLVFHPTRSKTTGPMDSYTYKIASPNPIVREKVDTEYYWNCNLIPEIGELMLKKYNAYKEQEEINRQILENDSILKKLDELKQKEVA